MRAPAAAALLALLWAAPAPAADKADAYFCSDIKKPFFRRGASGLVLPARGGSRAAAFPAEKPAGTFRVFVVGESAAAILGPGRPGPGLEVINCGMNGYESRRIASVLEEALAYGPDLVVLLSGNNEGGADPCPGFRAELSRRERRLLERYYAARGGGLPAAALASLKQQERRLGGMARAARRAKVPLVICTLPANLMLPPAGRPPLGEAGFARGLADLEAGDYAGAAAGLLPLSAGGEPFAAYYAGRALYAAGRRAAAAAQLARAADLSPAQERSGPARNAMIARAAAAGGACLADLAGAFAKAAPGGVPGFGLFSDGVHWRPAYGALAWKTIFSAAAGCGIAGAGGLEEAAAALPPNSGGEGPRARVSYAVSWLDGRGVSERSAAELGALLTEDKEAFYAAASSPEGLRKAFLSGEWSGPAAGDLPGLYPAFAANAAEALRRAGLAAEASRLCAKALAAAPGDPDLLLLKARILVSEGRRAAAAELLSGLAAAGKRPAGLEAAAETAGLDLPSPCAARAGASPASKRLSDAGVARLAAGDAAGAGRALLDSLKADPANAEALMTLCSLERSSPAAAAPYCAAAARAAMGPCLGPGAQKRRLAAEAWYNAALGGGGDAVIYLERALRAAPPDWPGAPAARALLRKARLGGERSPR